MIGLQEGFGGPVGQEFQKTVELVFGRKGWLEDRLGLEHRPEQARMATRVAGSFSGNAPLFFEAGTGVGKSLAYLVPSIINALEQKRQCVVSTHTISLQEQIQTQDLELCRDLFHAVPELEPYREFKNALLVGRGNYLCTTRLRQALQRKVDLFGSSEQRELLRIAEWAESSKSGLLQELSPQPSQKVWDWVNADSATCNRRNCGEGKCFFRMAKARVSEAQVIILNHSLLFALLAAGCRPKGDVPGVLFPKDFLVLDEAHHVPSVATNFFGDTITSYALNLALGLLFNPRRGKGLFTSLARRDDCEAVERALYSADSFFAEVGEQYLTRQDVVRVRQPGWAEAALEQPLAEVVQRTGRLADSLDDGPQRDELKDMAERLRSYQHGINRCLSLADEKAVYWVERSGRRGQNIALRSAPVEVAPLLRECLFESGTGVLLTSATLAEGPKMDSFKRKCGGGDLDSEQVNSPFDFANNMRVYVATDAPQPSREEKRLDIDFLTDSIKHCCLRFQGGSLVLFTSYRDMNSVARMVEPVFDKARRPFLLQGDGMSRSEIANTMRAEGNAIVFGTDSFWTGVDVPGAALSQVVMTRLPFSNPNHPVREAQSERVQARGGQPFVELTLPEALVKYRQGIGRLIRKGSDVGTVTILDSRVLTRQYGLLFLRSLPTSGFTRFSRANREQLFQPHEIDPQERQSRW